MSIISVVRKILDNESTNRKGVNLVFITVEQAAKNLQVSRKTIYNYIKSGKLKAHYLTEKNIRIDTDDLNAFVRGL